jgi:hypothetical protein
MPAKRELSMRQLRTLLRLSHDGVSAREIGRRLGVARSTIQDNLKRAAAAGLAWPLADDVTDDVLEQRLFGRVGSATGQRRREEPDWAALARELKRPGVTMMIPRQMRSICRGRNIERSTKQATATAGSATSCAASSGG